MRSWIRNAVLGAGAGALVLTGAPPAGAHDGGQTIELRDECDPVTFNEALGDGACNPRYGGSVTLDELVEELTEDPQDVLQDRNARGWKFSPRYDEVERGERLVLRNTGGEPHSFTWVARFGAGCVPELNAFFGLPPEHPICDDDTDPWTPGPDWFKTIVPAGESKAVRAPWTRGTHRYECMIHPWMRTTLTVE